MKVKEKEMKVNCKLVSILILSLSMAACSKSNPLLKGDLKENAEDIYLSAKYAENEVHWHKGEKGNFYIECVESASQTQSCTDLINHMREYINKNFVSPHLDGEVIQENLFDKNMWAFLKDYYKAEQYMDSQD